LINYHQGGKPDNSVKIVKVGGAGGLLLKGNKQQRQREGNMF